MMKKAMRSLIIVGLLAMLSTACALTDYQQGVLDGLGRGWFMSQKYSQALNGNATAYNQAVLDYNAWIQEVFGNNESLLLEPYTSVPSTSPSSYFMSKTAKPVHSIDASWNQSGSLLDEPDANGLIKGIPADSYYAIGPALADF